MIFERGCPVRLSERAAARTLPEVVGHFHYSRLGFGSRPITLLPGGEIGAGSAGLERWWRVRGTTDAPELQIGARALTATLRLGRDGVWRGKWLVHECMPVELRPIAAPDKLARSLRAALARVLREQEHEAGNGRGIVVAAGGGRLTTCAWVLVDRLRALGCTLPIELWHLGEVELGPAMRRRFAAQQVTCVDARQAAGGGALPAWTTWGLKPFAVRRSRFREVLLLDADNVPLRDPTFLFSEPDYLATGALFWPDFGRFHAQHPAWPLLGIAPLDEPEQESGQLVVDRARTETALAHVDVLNQNGSSVYQYVHGDKDTWRLGFHYAGAPYTLLRALPRALEGTMVQHAPDGTPLFQHRNLWKWSLTGANPAIADFVDEAACRRAVAALAAEWDGLPVRLEELPEAARAKFSALAGAEVELSWLGFDKLTLRFGQDQLVTEGASPLARRWYVGRDGSDWALVIEGDRGPTARLHPSGSDRWLGAWPGYPGVEAKLTWRPASKAHTSTAQPVPPLPSRPWLIARGPAAVSDVRAARALRTRDDRPGFEPLDPGPLPAPDLAAGTLALELNSGSSRSVWWRGPLWSGEPVDRLTVDLRGGLGDIVRWLPLLSAIVRSGRVGRVSARLARDADWFQGRVPGVSVLPPDARVEADVALCAIHELPRQRWTSWPRAPLTALAARAIELPLESLTGPCLAATDETDAVRARLLAAGWRGEPVIAVQADHAPALPRAAGYAFRAAKLSPSVCNAASLLSRDGFYVLAIGATGPTIDGPTVIDLRDSRLGSLVGAVLVADLVLGIDSAPVHLAGITGTPALALFGPSDPEIHLCARGSLAYTPPPEHCDQLPCGHASLVGQPQTTRGWIKPMRCPPLGPCLQGLDSRALARATGELALAVSGTLPTRAAETALAEPRE